MPVIGRGDAIALVVRELRDAILTGELRPGERIVQHAVAERLGVSRSPVREALRVLKAEGLVHLETKLGARVVRLDLGELLEIYWLREHIEPAAVAESVPLLSDAERQLIDRLPAEMERCWHQGESMRWFELDRRFHRTLLARTPMPEVRALSERLWNQAAPYIRAYVRSTPDRAAELTHLEHRLIAEAAVNGRPADAQQFLEIHIRRTRLALSVRPELLPPDAPALSAGQGKDATDVP